MNAPSIDETNLTDAERTLTSSLDTSELAAALEEADPSAAVNDLLKRQADKFHSAEFEPPPVRLEADPNPHPITGARVRLVGLMNKKELNNRIGTIVPDISGKLDDRIAVAVDGLAGKGIRLKPENVSIEDAVVRVRDAHQRRVLSKQVKNMDLNARKSGRLKTIERVLEECQQHRGLPRIKYGSSRAERVQFWSQVHNMSGARPDFSSSGLLVLSELSVAEREMLREGGYCE